MDPNFVRLFERKKNCLAEILTPPSNRRHAGGNIDFGRDSSNGPRILIGMLPFGWARRDGLSFGSRFHYVEMGVGAGKTRPLGAMMAATSPTQRLMANTVAVSGPSFTPPPGGGIWLRRWTQEVTLATMAMTARRFEGRRGLT